MPSAVCALCRSNDNARLLYQATIREEELTPAIFSARRAPDRLHGEILRCSRCGLVYPRNLLDPSELSALYRESRLTYGDQEPYIRRTYGKLLRRLLPKLTGQPRPLSFLDVGCGNGFMLKEARDCGCAMTSGVEPSASTVAEADTSIRSDIIVGMFSPEIFGERRFDVITCFQTLDHLQDPVTFVRQCYDLLKPGGMVLFVNHNIASWTARILKERCPMIDIEHTFLHTPATMQLLFSRANFLDIETFSVRNDYPLGYWAHLLPVPTVLKSWITKSIEVLGIRTLILPLSVGNMGLTARKTNEV